MFRERACLPELECSHFRLSALADLTSPFLAAAPGRRGIGGRVRAASGGARAKPLGRSGGRMPVGSFMAGAGPGASLARSRGHAISGGSQTPLNERTVPSAWYVH